MKTSLQNFQQPQDMNKNQTSNLQFFSAKKPFHLDEVVLLFGTQVNNSIFQMDFPINARNEPGAIEPNSECLIVVIK